ncbi:AraC family transcriptional regulator [Acetivibrio cellulolyticus]|uniref:AraC family transcriptional regulator n=1 Tax=Acetivibrio cellulolyticus TaxID=35830 RepID=UPI0001E304C0|nr:AraC family transcriptional regulator [Acetivibrio cellulolyticus]
MEWLDAMNSAVEYLEANINEKLDIEKVAKIALSSPFHFQRMYYMLTGVTIAEYVRRRRLTLAAQDIMAGDKIIDISYRYGYETPEAFTKAFRKMHGISPSAAREPGANLKAYPKLSFHISIKGDKSMDYKIVEKEAFTVVGKKTKITTANGENKKLIPEFWDNCNRDGSMEWLSQNAGKLRVMGVCTDLNTFCEGYFSYMLAIEKTKEPIPEGYVIERIPAATWAVFEAVGPMPESLQNVEMRVFSEWFPSTGYQHECAPELEIYSEGDFTAPDYRCEYWVPIKK